MYVDAQLEFDNAAEHLTTEASDNYLDLNVAVPDLGAGETLYFVIAVTTAFTDASSDSTMTITLETDDNTSFSSATTAQTVGTFAALSAVGTRLIVPLAPAAFLERYMRVKYTVANGDLSTGNFDAFITKDISQYRAFADGITIL